MEEQSSPQSSTRPIKRLILLIVLGTLAILSGSVFFSISSILKKPAYHYRNFRWSPDSSKICYFRTPYPSTPGSCEQELWLSEFNVHSGRKIASFRAPLENLTLLGWSREGDYLFVMIEKNPGKELFRISVNDMKVTQFNLELPGLSSLFYDRGLIYTVQRDEELGNETCGVVDCRDFQFTIIVQIKLKDEGIQEIRGAKTSFHLTYCALGIYDSARPDETGFTNLIIYNRNEKKGKKLIVDSYGKDMNFEWSPGEDRLVMRITERDATDTDLYAICFYDPRQEGKVDKLSTENPLAKSILKWETIGHRPSEFEISPDGAQIVFHTLSTSDPSKDDSFLMNIDGTCMKTLINPEGKRAIEVNGIYKFFHTSGKVIGDFLRFIQTGRRN